MNKRARSQRRKHPYNIPTETLGHVYRHVEDPLTFGRVNTAFRSVHTDPYFEKQRRQQMVENDIRINGGSRVFINVIPASSRTVAEEFYNGYGCVEIHHFVSQGSLGRMFVTTGSSIKRVLYKGILGIKTIMGDPQFKPVGRFNLLEQGPRQTSDATRVEFLTDIHDIMERAGDRLDENNPQLRSDLLRAMRNDLQSGCAPRVFWAVNKVGRRHPKISEHLTTIQKAEDQNYSVRQILGAFFRVRFDDEDATPERERIRIVGDTLEITLNIKLRYNIFDGVSTVGDDI